MLISLSQISILSLFVWEKPIQVKLSHTFAIHTPLHSTQSLYLAQCDQIGQFFEV